MTLRSSSSLVCSVSALAFVLVACGGSVGSIGDSKGSSGSSGTSGSSGSNDGTSGGSSGSSGTNEPLCTPGTLGGDRACVPGTAIAGQPISVAVDASQGCLGCFTTFQPCDVTVGPGTVQITMKTLSCPPPGDQACPAVCQVPRTTCIIPPLAAGTYRVSVTGEGARANQPPRDLVVSDSAGASSCTLPDPGSQPAPIDGGKLAKSCSQDADCKAVTVGSQCGACSCPNLAISTSALAEYEDERRAKTSQCEVPQDGIACAGCKEPVVRCAIDGTSLTGTCTLN